MMPMIAAALQGANAYRVFMVAASLLALDTFISVGPPKAWIHKVFGMDARLNPKKAQRLVSQLAARFVGAVFLAVMFPLAFATLRDSRLTDKLYGHTPTSDLCIDIAAGYFMYDVFICTVRFHENGLAFLIHALGCCTVFTFAATYKVLHYYGAAFLMWELSTPFIYVRWVLLKLGYSESRLLKFNLMAGFLVFLLCRNVYGPIMSWGFWQTTGSYLASPRPGGFSPATIYAFRSVCILLNGLNYFWLSQMLRLALGAPHPKAAKQTKQS